MRAIMVMFDSLNRHMLQPYGCTETLTPNFLRLQEKAVQFDTCYAASLPCMPARRELHTGRYNFLHRSWGPIEPFDDSMPQILKENGVHSHLVSDHGHYWEDGGATYHTRYQTWENFRGQEGDPWKGVVGGVEDTDPNLIRFTGYRGKLYRQDLVNRSYMPREEDHPQVKCFAAGMEFIERNKDADRWFLQIECFDPHEPFFTYDKYKDLYPHEYSGERFDWPDYALVKETPEEIQEGRYNYAALLSMCDAQLGKVLDLMDENDMWKDTMLIVNTDHGYMLGEHGYWAKNYMPLYEEITHIPLYIWDPRCGKKGERRKELVQTIDLPVTLLRFFDIPVPKDMLGEDLHEVIERDEGVRQAALFGIHGGMVCCTDGRYVLMKAPKSPENLPLYEYTMMPTHMAGFFSPRALRSMQAQEPFSFTKGAPVMRMEADGNYGGGHGYGDLLFDLETDPKQEHPIEDAEIKGRMEQLMAKLMRENDAPVEQYERLGLNAK